jgi:hypothetical protein
VFSLPDAGFVNDVVLTRGAAYFTDSLVQQLYRVRIGRRGRLGEPRRTSCAAGRSTSCATGTTWARSST